MSDMPISALVGRNVRRLRETRKITQAELVKRLAERGWLFHVSGLSAREHGTRPITVDELMLLAEALDVAAYALLEDPECAACLDAPPSGFSCNACGAGGGER